MQSKKSKNSLIELFRFLFSLNVVKNHGLFCIESPYFGPGRVSVEFFFILSGFLFAGFLEKSREMPLKKSIPKLFYSKLSPLFIPIIIGLVCNLISDIVTGDIWSGIWGYLWYIESMMLTMLAYTVIRRIIKNDRVFYTCVWVVFALATAMRFFSIFHAWGNIRAFAALSLGILLSRLPRLRLKNQWPVWLMLIPVMAACFAIVCFRLVDATWHSLLYVEFMLDNLLYPALIYLTFCIDFKCSLFNYLGALSFGLYAFQCPADLLRTLGITNLYILFAFIIFATLIEDSAKRILAKTKRRNCNESH